MEASNLLFITNSTYVQASAENGCSENQAMEWLTCAIASWLSLGTCPPAVICDASLDLCPTTGSAIIDLSKTVRPRRLQFHWAKQGFGGSV